MKKVTFPASVRDTVEVSTLLAERPRGASVSPYGDGNQNSFLESSGFSIADRSRFSARQRATRRAPAMSPSLRQGQLRPVMSAMSSSTRDAEAQPVAVMIARQGCNFCAAARHLLDVNHIQVVELPVSDSVRWKVLQAMVGKATVPQVWMDGHLIGGFEDLQFHLRFY
eukprot:Gregarina_sp_Poly_1__995@NODE_1241_length_4666_cov_269_446184_g846_i0_p2_GENE_NODE_1241_length_4666_cov_269_446184_g846_i0NODE_1241_length_4666_cov_269_446184_g846_i0_p2_ORF_typecomplete_len168_score23_85Glutaredoxin/PF00462_24/3_9e07_NODE_1241_length_4666_cov_269_446184_g846_i025853088